MSQVEYQVDIPANEEEQQAFNEGILNILNNIASKLESIDVAIAALDARITALGG